MIASAPISTALCTFLNSISRSVISREVPRLTLIFVLSIEPSPLGDKAECSLLHGIIARPSAISPISLSVPMRSFSATAAISFVKTPRRAASICVE